MKTIFCITGGKYRKFKNPKVLYINENTFLLSSICSKYENEDEKIFKEESIEILKILGLIENI